MLRVVLAAMSIATMSAVAASPPQAKLHAAVVNALKDADSARFRGEFTSRSDNPSSATLSLCGEVNAKNGFGGYGGFHHFIANTDGMIVFEENEPSGFNAIWATWCSRP